MQSLLRDGDVVLIKNKNKIKYKPMILMFVLFFSSLLDLDPLSSTGPTAASAAPTSWGGKKLHLLKSTPTTGLNVLLFGHITRKLKQVICVFR